MKVADEEPLTFKLRTKRKPQVETYEGKTPALGDHQARALLDTPDEQTLKGKRDRAILSVLLFHALRREELCKLKVKDITERRGVKYFRVHGKGGKIRFVPCHSARNPVQADHQFRDEADQFSVGGGIKSAWIKPVASDAG